MWCSENEVLPRNNVGRQLCLFHPDELEVSIDHHSQLHGYKKCNNQTLGITGVIVLTLLITKNPLATNRDQFSSFRWFNISVHLASPGCPHSRCWEVLVWLFTYLPVAISQCGYGSGEKNLWMLQVKVASLIGHRAHYQLILSSRSLDGL